VQIIQFDGTADPELIALLDNINSLPDSQIPGALEELLPTLAGAGLQILPTIGGAMSNVIDTNSGAGGSPSGDTPRGDRFVWMKPFAMTVNQDSENSVPGYDADIGGLVLGADDEISDGLRAGWSLGYARTNMDGNGGFNHQSLDIDTYQLGLYARKELESDAYATGKISFGYNDNESKRQISSLGGGTAKADYDSWYTLINATVGWDVLHAGINYVYMDQDSYTERGSPAALRVKGQNADSLIFSIGSKGSFKVDEQTAITAHLELGYDALSDGIDLSSTFVGGGPAFKTQGADPGSFVANGGIGLQVFQGERTEMSVNYDATWRDNYSDQSLSATLRYKW
jgi:outer membrane autotransporter protein